MDDTEASQIIDDFTNEVSIQLTKLAGSVNHLFVDTYELSTQDVEIEQLTYIGLQFAYFKKEFYLRLKGRINKGDTIHFLFENGAIINKTIISGNFLNRYEYTDCIKLENEDLKIFCSSFLNKWKLTNKIMNTYKVGGFLNNSYYRQYKYISDGQYLLLKSARTLIMQIVFHEKNPELENLLT